MFRGSSVRASVVGVVAGVMGWTAAAVAFPPVPFFQGLGDLPGGSFESRALGVSADGMTVVGNSVSNHLGVSLEGFRWSGGIMTAIDPIVPGSVKVGTANAVSADGSVVVGRAGSEAIRWSGGNTVGLGFLPGGMSNSQAFGVSADGNTVVGTGVTAAIQNEAFRWTPGGGMVGLGFLGGGLTSQAAGVSADGNTIVGQGRNAGNQPEAFRWTAAGGMVGLGDLPGGAAISSAKAVSADGNTIVGQGRNAGNWNEAFRWTAAGMVGLGFLPGGGGTSSVANAVSADGTVVVGTSGASSLSNAFIWDSVNGMRSLQDVLVNDLGLDLGGFTQLQLATGISADGMTIVGQGFNANHLPEAFIARLPEPATLALLALGGGVLLRRRARGVPRG